MLFFETDDLDFSITVVRLEEIIRQLCANDPNVNEDFLARIEEVLRIDSFQIDDKVKMLTVLAKQKELFEEVIKKLEDSNDEIMKNFRLELVQFQKSNINNSINIQEFEKLINDMKSNEKLRNILLEKSLEKIDSKVSKIDEKTDKMVSLLDELPDKMFTKIKEDNGM